MTAADQSASGNEPSLDLARIALRRAKETARSHRLTSRVPSRHQPMRRGRQPAAHIQGVLLEMFSQWRLGNPGLMAVLMGWPSVAGPLARHISPAAFDEYSSTLTLYCDSAAWLTQGQLLEDRLLQRLNNELGEQRVHRLRFKKTDRLLPPASFPAPQPAVTRLPGSPPAAPDLAIGAARQRQDEALPREPA
ncbi:DUF721 domain-containing protein [Streptomyces sp. NPDC086783]|uniref:DUF721 domain-containing protein n=1 Tax=Streptomyces sp. NPDC086783 TaxID=3365758 RepID=UPI0037FFF682